MIKKSIKITVLILLAIQLYRPAKNISNKKEQSDFMVQLKPDKSIENIIKTSCYDCHSNHTVYPWYADIAPVSWILADHIDEGKDELNFSIWGTYSTKRKKKKLQEMDEMIGERKMPLTNYLYMHKDAAISDKNIAQLLAWLKTIDVE